MQFGTGKSKSECRKTDRVKAFRRMRKKSDVEQVAEAYMLKWDHPKFKGKCISATGASKSECRETHRVKAFSRLGKKSDVEQVAEASMLKRDHPNSKWQLEFSATRASKSECRRKLTVPKRFAISGRSLITSSRSIHAQEGITRNSKATGFRQPGASKSDCRETLRAKGFRRLRKNSDGEQVQELYMLKTDHPKFKGNWISAT
ncbi:hypothetical protein D5086_023680 [Populus alba]|uniref:Uncharacterized protein n=1 Tax=Populus alba TaxID=43335 RepID=A0ACC4BAH1_POPAL